MSLKGSLESINLADIMQLYTNSNKSGRFVLTRPNGDEGMIYIRNGEIVHSEVGNYQGEDAIFTLVAWDSGNFIFDEEDFDTSTTISSSVTSLLMESARRIDEWKLLRKKIGSIDSIPQFSEIDRRERRKISLSTLEWMVIAKIDGNKNIDQISKESGINIFDTSRMIFGMIASGLLTLKHQ